MTLSFEEAVFGCKKEVSINRVESCPDCHGTGCEPGTTAEVCPDCHGSGYVTVQQRTMLGVMRSQQPCKTCGGKGKIIHQPCKTCRGAGAVRKARKITVNIPAGVGYGQTPLCCGDRATRARTAAPPATSLWWPRYVPTRSSAGTAATS